MTCNYFAVFGLFQTAKFRTLVSSDNVIIAEVLGNCLLIENMVVAEMVKKFARLYVEPLGSTLDRIDSLLNS
jgi:hypothetical protein